jgi:cyclohexyl-isocyanide hydratase
MGVEVIPERVVIDRDGRITGGGVTAGIDFALTIAAQLCGEDTAKFIELLLEYNPAPPFGVGSPEKAGSQLTRTVLNRGKPINCSRRCSQPTSRFYTTGKIDLNLAIIP